MNSRETPPHSDQGQKLALTYRETGASLGVCERTVWGLVRDGELPAIRIGRSVRVPVKGLQDYVQSQAELDHAGR